MQNNRNHEMTFEETFDDAVTKGLIKLESRSGWIEKAVRQKSKNMTIRLALSRIYITICKMGKESLN